MLVVRKSRVVTTGSFSQQFNTEFDSIHLKSTSGYQDWTTNCDPCACASLFSLIFVPQIGSYSLPNLHVFFHTDMETKRNCPAMHSVNPIESHSL